VQNQFCVPNDNEGHGERGTSFVVPNKLSLSFPRKLRIQAVFLRLKDKNFVCKEFYRLYNDIKINNYSMISYFIKVLINKFNLTNSKSK
jgi:hypothetical protein